MDPATKSRKILRRRKKHLGRNTLEVAAVSRDNFGAKQPVLMNFEA
jgi:hypothetical protein